MAQTQKIGVLVVDDSAFMRKVISEIVNGSSEFTVVDTARDGQDALDKLASRGAEIQLVTLDIQMPGMDGLAALQHIMAEHPRRVVMVSSLTTEGAVETLQALEYGAVDFIAKPGGAISLQFESVGPQLIEVLKGASRSQLPRPGARPSPTMARHHAPAQPALKPENSKVVKTGARRLVAVASSTGGPKALASFIPHLPKNLGAAMIVVQHMPATFTALMAERLDKSSQISVKEAAEGDRLISGCCLIAPGGCHMELTPQETIHLTKDPPVVGLRPCADVTFRTVASVFGKRALGVVLTGMGRDGTDGCRVMKERGSTILAESKDTALIYGMPKSVIEAGIATREYPIEQMAQAVVDQVEQM
jgi:two-component system, chemotaxis family, protein-glutamate methylesterase/glutaminase